MAPKNPGRGFSFELLPRESSGDAEIVGKSQGRRRRKIKASKKNSISNIESADLGRFAGCFNEPLKSGIPEGAETANGRISEACNESVIFNNQAVRVNGDSVQSDNFRQQTYPDADANAAHSPLSEVTNLVSRPGDESVAFNNQALCVNGVSVQSDAFHQRADSDADANAAHSPLSGFSNLVCSHVKASSPNISNRGFSEPCSSPDLRQRIVTTCGIEKDDMGRNTAEDAFPIPILQSEKQSHNSARATFGTPQALDWERLTTANSDHPSNVETSPLKYFLGEINGGNSLRSTTSVGNENKRQRVYNTMFHVPWRCELLIDVGFFVCLDSFLSLLTIMPARILRFVWRCLNARQFQRPCADELSDFGSSMILICGVALLQLTDISLIYHVIRGQGTIKLYVVYNVLEIFDKLCQSFGDDVLQVLFNSAEGVASCSREYMAFETMRFFWDQMIAVVAFLVHSFIILAQAITLSTAIISHNNALLALLVSNNFAEIKSNVFKRVSQENLHKMAYYDTVERFHIMAYLLFVLAQNILEAEGTWFWSFATNACMVWWCEIVVDVIKHAFLAKFNEIKPAAYSDFLEALCRQTLNSQSHEDHQMLSFVPFAPACLVIRVLTPIYATLVPCGPLWRRWFWAILHLSVTYILLATLKVMVSLGLQMHARWYIHRRFRRKRHFHAD